MANAAFQLTGKSTPSGRIPYLQYTPSDLSKKQPAIIYLHGQGNRSTTHNTSSVLSIQAALPGDATSGVEGLPWLTNSINPRTGGLLPHFLDKFGNSLEPYCFYPQLYGVPGLNSTLWDNYYTLEMIKLARSIPTIDETMIYLTGYSLGMGGTFTAIMDPAIQIYLAAAAGNSPGYASGAMPVGLDHQSLAESGLPVWWAHAADDTTAVIGVSHTIYNKVMSFNPLCPLRFTEYTTGNHGIQGRVFDERVGTSYPMVNGLTFVHTPNIFQWLFRHQKKDLIQPFYR